MFWLKKLYQITIRCSPLVYMVLLNVYVFVLHRHLFRYGYSRLSRRTSAHTETRYGLPDPRHHYYKFLVARHPLDRLASAYLNQVNGVDRKEVSSMKVISLTHVNRTALQWQNAVSAYFTTVPFSIARQYKIQIFKKNYEIAYYTPIHRSYTADSSILFYFKYLIQDQISRPTLFKPLRANF